MKNNAFTAVLRVAFLAVTMFVLESLFGLITAPLIGINNVESAAGGANRAIGGIATAAVVHACIISLITVRSRWRGVRLALALAGIFYGIRHLLNAVEGFVFLQNILPPRFQLVNLTAAVIPALAFGFLSAWSWGKLGKPASNADSTSDKKTLPDLPAEESYGFRWNRSFLLRALMALLIWYFLYFSAGSLLAMSIPDVVEFYFGVDSMSALAAGAEGADGAMSISAVPLGYALQVIRVGIWIALALMLLSMLKGSWWERSFIVGLAFAFLMATDLVIANPIQPDIVRLAHFPEIVIVNLLWGFILTWLLKDSFTRPPAEPH